MKRLTTRNMGFIVIAIITSLFTLNSCDEDDDTGGLSSEEIEDLLPKINANRGFAIEGETINFEFAHDTIPNNISSYAWTFEGGSPEASTEATPSVTYSSVGTFEASLTITRASDSKEFTGTYDVRVFEEPTTAFMADTQTIEEGGQVIFRSMSSSNENLVWTFEGGDPETSTEEEVVVTYATGGTFDVTLSSAENGGQTTSTEADYIEVTDSATPTFTASATTIDQRQSVTYTNTTPTTGATLRWTFTGGDITSSTANEVTVTYPEPGAFDVTLAVTNQFDVTKTLEEIGFITVNDIPEDAFLLSAESSTDGTEIVITYDLPLNDPSLETITVAADNVDLPVASVALDPSDSTKIVVTLSTPISSESSVITVNYATPGITTVEGGAVTALTDEVVTNNFIDANAFFFSAISSSDGSEIIITYDKPLNDPSGETIAIAANGANAPVSSIALDPSDNRSIIVTLTTPIASDAVVLTANYTPSIQTTLLGTVATLTDQAVINSFTTSTNLFEKGDFEGITTAEYNVNTNFQGNGDRSVLVADLPDNVGISATRGLRFTITGGTTADRRALTGDFNTNNVQLITPLAVSTAYTIKAVVKYTGVKPTSVELGVVQFPFTGGTLSFGNLDISGLVEGEFMLVEGTLTTTGTISDTGYAIPRVTAGNGDTVLIIDNYQVFAP